MSNEILPIIVVPAVVIGMVIFRTIIGQLDHERIKEVCEKKGWEVISISWAPFSPGAIMEKGERSYCVKYKNGNNIKERYCKTSITTGVFWRDDNY